MFSIFSRKKKSTKSTPPKTKAIREFGEEGINALISGGFATYLLTTETDTKNRSDSDSSEDPQPTRLSIKNKH